MKYFVILALIILAWTPWISKEEAVIIVDAKVAQIQASTPNLCIITIHKDSIRKVPFGYTEKVAYDCTTGNPVFGILKSTNVVFISFLKVPFGIPRKTFTILKN